MLCMSITEVVHRSACACGHRLRENLSIIIEARKKKYYWSQIFQIENSLLTNDSYKFSQGIKVSLFENDTTCFLKHY